MSTPLIRNAIEDFLAQQATTKASWTWTLILALDATASKARDLGSCRQAAGRHVPGGCCHRQARRSTGVLPRHARHRRRMPGILLSQRCPAARPRLMNHVTCRAGHTQITRVLPARPARDHDGATGERALATSATCARTIRTSSCRAARALGQPKVPTFMFQEGRNPSARRVFRIACAGSGRSGTGREGRNFATQEGRGRRCGAV